MNKQDTFKQYAEYSTSDLERALEDINHQRARTRGNKLRNRLSRHYEVLMQLLNQRGIK